MAARFHALDDDRIGAGADQLLGQRHRGAKHMTLAPPSFSFWMAPPGGKPPASTTCPTLVSRQTPIRSINAGCMVMRLTPNGLSVSPWVALISVRSRSGVIEPQAITPKPPPLEMAETRWRSETQVMAPPHDRIAAAQERASPLPQLIQMGFCCASVHQGPAIQFPGQSCGVQYLTLRPDHKRCAGHGPQARCILPPPAR